VPDDEPPDGPAPGEGWDALVDALYSAPPEGFVAARDDAVRAARERGDRAFATAAARLRRPTRAAWLANLLARRRPEQLEGLLGLAGSLADAQRTLDGPALRALSAQRRRLVGAMAREAGQLAREAHEPAGDALVREVGEILEAALADPVVADEVRSGRLTRTVSYSGFGLPADAGSRTAPPAPPPPAPREAPRPPDRDGDGPDGDGDRRREQEAARRRAEEEARRRAEEEARRREREARRTELAEAERDEQRAHERRDAAEAARDDAAAEHDATRERIAALSAELDAARERERAAAERAREAATAARAAARDAGTAATRTARARARLEEID
jgi:hypothetical protein